MTESTYMLDNDWVYERERFHALESNLDPGTINSFSEIGVPTGWNCLEVGAGGGSITEWLCNQVGPDGTVTAIDLNTRFVGALEYDNLEILEQDLVTEEFPEVKYGLVHTRFTLAHIPEREAVLDKMVQALSPGGWLLVEEPDFSTDMADPAAPASKRQLFESGMMTIKELQAKNGMDRYLGNTLFGKLISLGLTNVKAIGRAPTLQGGTPESKESALTMEQLQAPAMALGLMSEQEYIAFRSLFDDKEFYFRGYMMTSAWGQKPQ